MPGWPSRPRWPQEVGVTPNQLVLAWLLQASRRWFR